MAVMYLCQWILVYCMLSSVTARSRERRQTDTGPIHHIIDDLGGRQEVDFIIILDRSRAVASRTFYLQSAPFSRELIAQYATLHPDYVRLTVVTYSDDATTVVIKPGGESDTKCSLFSGDFSSLWSSRVTYDVGSGVESEYGGGISGALSTAYMLFTLRYNTRPGAHQVLLVVTNDARGASDVRSNLINNTQVRIYTVGLGRGSNSVRALATDQDQDGKLYGTFARWQEMLGNSNTLLSYSTDTPALLYPLASNYCDNTCPGDSECHCDVDRGQNVCLCLSGYFYSAEDGACEECSASDNQYKDHPGNDVTCAQCPVTTESSGTECVCPVGIDTCSDPCQPNPCATNMKCKILTDTDYRCECEDGWEGTGCDVNTNACADECVSGRCVDGLGFGAVTCVCTDWRYTGHFCQIRLSYCSPGACAEHSTCVDTETDFRCESGVAPATPNRLNQTTLIIALAVGGAVIVAIATGVSIGVLRHYRAQRRSKRLRRRQQQKIQLREVVDPEDKSDSKDPVSPPRPTRISNEYQIPNSPAPAIGPIMPETVTETEILRSSATSTQAVVCIEQHYSNATGNTSSEMESDRQDRASAHEDRVSCPNDVGSTSDRLNSYGTGFDSYDEPPNLSSSKAQPPKLTLQLNKVVDREGCDSDDADCPPRPARLRNDYHIITSPAPAIGPIMPEAVAEAEILRSSNTDSNPPRLDSIITTESPTVIDSPLPIPKVPSAILSLASKGIPTAPKVVAGKRTVSNASASADSVGDPSMAASLVSQKSSPKGPPRPPPKPLRLSKSALSPTSSHTPTSPIRKASSSVGKAMDSQYLTTTLVEQDPFFPKSTGESSSMRSNGKYQTSIPVGGVSCPDVAGSISDRLNSYGTGFDSYDDVIKSVPNLSRSSLSAFVLAPGQTEEMLASGQPDMLAPGQTDRPRTDTQGYLLPRHFTDYVM